eukprot:403351991
MSIQIQTEFNIHSEPFYPKSLSYNELPVDQNLQGMLVVDALSDCSCCKGVVNNCNGDFCQNLGICFCYLNHQQQKQFKEEQQDKQSSTDDDSDIESQSEDESSERED